MSDRDEFREQIELLFAGYDKPLTEAKVSAFRIALRDMALPKLTRAVESMLLRQSVAESVTKTLTPGSVWAAAKELRAIAPSKSADPPIDPWEVAGNTHLLKHIRVRIGRDPKRWGDAGAFDMDSPARPWSRRPAPEFVSQVQRLARARDSWVSDMHDLDKGDGVPVDLQKRIWADYIKAAEGAKHAD